MSGRLYKNVDSLDVMEQLENDSYDFIYLDVPYYSGVSIFDMVSDENRIRRYLSKSQSIPMEEVDQQAIEKEKTDREKKELKKYTEYITKVIENSHRLLKDNGVLAFLCPCHEYVDINYRLILDQFFPSFSVVTIEKKQNATSRRQDNNYNLFFYSKKKDFVRPALEELRPISEFTNRDDFDYYKKTSAFISGLNRPDKVYEWHGITPNANQHWRFPREKMDEMDSEGRVIFDNGRIWIKKYRSEDPLVISSVWKYVDNTGYSTFIDSQSIERMFKMFVKSDSRILCPYERDGKFSLFADNMGVIWDAIYIPWKNDMNLISSIPREHYEIIEDIKKVIHRNYRNDVLTNVNDIDEIKEKLEKITNDVRKIQLSIGIDDDSELSINTVVDRIHQVVTDALSAYSIDGCLPEAQAWIDPFWDKLEPESQHFVPTGILLYNQFNSKPGIDQAPIMIEFCKSLEKELFKKMYFGYIYDVIRRNIDIKVTFPEAFIQPSTAVFADFVLECSTIKKNTPEEWKFEMGKMAFVLQSALSRHPREPIIIDFRSYLNRVFDQEFFREHFSDRLHVITKLRNACAHPAVIDQDSVDEGKELIRKKLLLLLKYYTK